MYKILVFGMTENPGGVESVIMNYYHYMDKNTFHFDFLCNSYNKNRFRRRNYFQWLTNISFSCEK